MLGSNYNPDRFSWDYSMSPNCMGYYNILWSDETKINSPNHKTLWLDILKLRYLDKCITYMPDTFAVKYLAIDNNFKILICAVFRYSSGPCIASLITFKWDVDRLNSDGQLRLQPSLYLKRRALTLPRVSRWVCFPRLLKLSCLRTWGLWRKLNSPLLISECALMDAF